MAEKSDESDEDVGGEERVVYSTEVISKLDNQSQRSFDIMHPRDDEQGQSSDWRPALCRAYRQPSSAYAGAFEASGVHPLR